MSNITRGTVCDSIVFEGHNPEEIIGKSKVSINPAKCGSGITFKVHGAGLDYASFPFDIFHLYAKKGKAGSRYAMVSAKKDEDLKGKVNKKVLNHAKVYVVEHLLSAMHAAGITDAEIELRSLNGDYSGVVPIVGVGIDTYFKELNKKRIAFKKPIDLLYAVKSDEYIHVDNKTKLKTRIRIEPSNSLEARVKSAKHSDLPDLNEKEFHVKSVYESIGKHLKARPLARTKERWKYFALNLLCFAGYKAITNENYVIVAPTDGTKEIVRKMQPKYRRKRNEYLAHTIFSDFLGEMYALGSAYVKGNFTLENTNHPTRIAALKQFQRNDVFKYER